jgi:CHASE2 domain-containing sensor protein
MVIRTARIRRLGVCLLLVESAAVGGASLWFCYELFAAKPKHLVAALFELAVFLLFGAVLFYAARRLPTGERAGRTPALLINLLALPISYYLIQAGRWPIALPVALIAVLVIVALISAEK